MLYLLKCSPCGCTIVSMIHRVLLSKQAAKDLGKAPVYIVMKLQAWKDGVEKFGLEEMRKRLGFHDEPLKERPTLH